MSAELPPAGVVVETNSDGLTLRLQAPLTQEMVKALGARATSVSEIQALFQAEVGDLELLPLFTNLRRLQVVNRTAADLAQLHMLDRLTSLTVDSSAQFDINCAFWPNLESLCFRWNGKFINLQRATMLRKLRVFSWQAKDLQLLLSSADLTTLELADGSLTSLRGLSSCSALRNLMLMRCSKLSDFEDLGTLRALRKLSIDTCRKFATLDHVSNLVDLEELYIDNVGPIPSLHPIARMKSLRVLHFTESTNVLDGDTAIVRNLGLEYSFMNRKHYNFTYDHVSGAEDK